MKKKRFGDFSVAIVRKQIIKYERIVFLLIFLKYLTEEKLGLFHIERQKTCKLEGRILSCFKAKTKTQQKIAGKNVDLCPPQALTPPRSPSTWTTSPSPSPRRRAPASSMASPHLM